MLNDFGAPQEQSDFVSKTIMTGKCAYTIAAVNPDNAKLKELGLYTTQDEPVYIGEREDSVNKEIKYPLARITVILKKVSDDEAETPVYDRVTYDLTNRVKVSANTGKYPCLNTYGQEGWFEKSDIDAGQVPSNMATWFFSEGLKTALDGEANLIRFIRALFNFKNVDMKSTTLADDKLKYKSLLRKEDLDKLFAGDFNDIRALLMRKGPEDKLLEVGFLLGAKVADTGKIYQDMFKEMPLRKYQVTKDSNDYLIKQVNESQAAGKYANTIFDLTGNLSLKEFDKALAPKPDSNQTGSADMSSAPAPTQFGEDENDLPF